MDEEEGRFFFTQLINAMDYCHKHKIAHRYS
jgi:serine/threonine protein kinase